MKYSARLALGAEGCGAHRARRPAVIDTGIKKSSMSKAEPGRLEGRKSCWARSPGTGTPCLKARHRVSRWRLRGSALDRCREPPESEGGRRAGQDALIGFESRTRAAVAPATSGHRH